MWNNFNNFFTVIFLDELQKKITLDLPLHLKSVAALPWETVRDISVPAFRRGLKETVSCRVQLLCACDMPAGRHVKVCSSGAFVCIADVTTMNEQSE